MSHVKTSEGYDVKVPSNGQVNLNTVLGALGTASFLGMNGGNILGGLGNCNRNGWNGNNGCCSEDHLVTRYELETENKLAAKDAEIALLKANTYNDQKALELYKYIDGELRGIREFICEQKVRNQGNTDAIRELSRDIDAKVALEAERRCCADQRIVAYVNGTFAPKVVVGFTPDATDTTPANTYNPLCCGCDK